MSGKGYPRNVLPSTAAALVQAVEEVNGAWWDEGDHIDYRPDLFELLVELRGAYNDYEAAIPAQREPASEDARVEWERSNLR